MEGMFLFFVVVALIFYGVYLLRNIPILSIPIGILFMTPALWALGWVIVQTSLRAAEYSIWGNADLGFASTSIFVLAVPATMGAYLLFTGMRRLRPLTRRVFARCMALSPLLALCVAYGVSNLTIWRVVDNAEALAGDKPYCTEYSLGKYFEQDNPPIPFTRALGHQGMAWGWYDRPDITLAIGDGAEPAQFFWSYKENAFVAQTRSRSVYCRPKAHYALRREEMEKEDAPSSNFRYTGMIFAIPLAYRGKTDFYNTGPTIRFQASPPDFAPLKGKHPNAGIEVEFGEFSKLSGRLKKDDANFIVETSGEEYGLRKQLYWQVQGNQRSQSGPPTVQYFKGENEVTTIIDCPPQHACSQTFDWQGRRYSFTHEAPQLSNWKNMQDKLVNRVWSFVVYPPLPVIVEEPPGARGR